MNDAQTYYIRKNQSVRTKTAKAVTPTTQRICHLDAKTQRRKRSSERQTQISACSNASDGFLRTSFLPKLQDNKTVQASQKTVKMQKDFYASLSNLSNHYKIKAMQTNQFEYPNNIALAIWDMEEKLQHNVLNWQKIRLVQDKEKTYFISEEKYNTGTTLYYIPIEPLYQMLHDPKRKRNSQLLISICSYLYHSADIPYFRQEDTYLYWMYEMHKNWMEQDDEAQENETYKLEFEKVESIGDYMEQKIFNRINLSGFEQRINSFKCRDSFDLECLRMAKNAFALYKEYPNETIFRNAPKKEDNESEEYETIGMEKYISFISQTKGWLYESIAETINNEFNEYGAMEEPTICKHFEEADVTNNSLNFENKLFALLDDMCSLLYNYETTRK